MLRVHEQPKKNIQGRVMIPLSAEHKIFVGFTYFDYFYYAIPVIIRRYKRHIKQIYFKNESYNALGETSRLIFINTYA